MGNTRTTTRPLMVIRAARTRMDPGWIVHDIREPAQVATPPWRRTPTRHWRKYPTHQAAIRAACRALKAGTPLTPDHTEFNLAR